MVGGESSSAVWVKRGHCEVGGTGEWDRGKGKEGDMRR